MVTIAPAVVSIASMTVASMTVTSIAVTAITRWAALELLILFLDIGNQVFAKLLGLLDHVGVGSSDVEKHVLVALMVGSGLKVSGSSTLDLHTAASLLLDMLDISSSMSNNLSTQVETMYRLQAYRDLLLGPFALWLVSIRLIARL
jgi:hypothetical protein